MADELVKTDPEIEQFLSPVRDALIALFPSAASLLTAGMAHSASGAAALAVAIPTASVAAAYVVYLAAKELCGQKLSKRQHLKVAVSTILVSSGVQDDLAQGRKVRVDDFFDRGVIDRSKADELIEGVFLSVQRENEEKKIKFISNVFREACFRDDISTEELPFLLVLSRECTYEQLCLLRILDLNLSGNALNLRQVEYDRSDFPRSLELTLVQLFRLVQSEVIILDDSKRPGERFAVLEPRNIIPSEMRLTKIGNALVDLMRLSELPSEDLDPIIQRLIT
jgi:hypothetical protein